MAIAYLLTVRYKSILITERHSYQYCYCTIKNNDSIIH